MKPNTLHIFRNALGLFLVWISVSVTLDVSAQTTVILVRHAEKENVPSKDPGLSAEGKERAQELSRMLTATPVDQVFSTPYERTRQTVRPVADRLGLEVQEYDPSAPEKLIEQVKRYKNQTILIAGHSNTTPALVNLLVGERKYADLNESDYDNLYIVNASADGASVIVLKYGCLR